MANLNDKLPSNSSGNYYVDASCIDCDMCRGTAPMFFRRDEDLGFSIVFRQPVTADEINLAEQARLDCPSDSIGSDGDSSNQPE